MACRLYNFGAYILHQIRIHIPCHTMPELDGRFPALMRQAEDFLLVPKDPCGNAGGRKRRWRGALEGSDRMERQVGSKRH